MFRLLIFLVVSFGAAWLLIQPGASQSIDKSKAPKTAFTFRDVGDEAGLFPHVAGIAGHGVGWGDVDGNGYPDLYVGTFGAKPYDSKPNMFFRNDKGKFRLDEQKPLRIVGRANGAVFADLNNNGRLDLYTTNHAIDGTRYKMPHFSTPNALFRNDGDGQFTDVSKDSGVCPMDFPARSVAVLDYDGDGRLDLLVGECFFQGGKSRSRLFRNLGNMKFEEVTVKVGLPEQVTGFGVAAADVTGNGWPDIFLAGRHHGNRLFINDGKGRFTEVPATHANFQWQYPDASDDTTTGVCFGDVNRDGLPDIVIGHHYSRPWVTGGVRNRLYLHRGLKDGFPVYEDVTEKVGLVPLPMKGPHVEIQDFDNDGWPDIYTSMVMFAGGQPYPVIFKNLGVKNGLPQFHTDALGVNDFPTEEDRQLKNVGQFFDKMQKDGKVVYMAPGPSADFDRDGKLDLFLANWWVPQRSLLLKNETPSGNWLQVAVQGGKGMNTMGIGSVIRVYPAGKLGQKEALLGCREIAVGYGYASGQEAIAHFGLGDLDQCDLEVLLPHGQGRIERKNVAANQRLMVKP
ncbi:MAG: CRTAC1 family protein [Gemmataceae bacterium]